MNIPCWWPCFCKLVPPETIEIEVRHCSFLMEALRTNVMKWWRIDVSKAMWAHCSAMLSRPRAVFSKLAASKTSFSTASGR
eukprot:g14129.t2